MKHAHIVLTTLVSGMLLADCHVCVEPKWSNLEQSKEKEKKFGGKLMLVGTFTFRKRCKECVKLNKLILRWHGENIENLCASLYKKLPEKNLLPIEEQLVCDGCWNKSEQRLIFNFNEEQTLTSVDTFYLVLTVPTTLEKQITKGRLG